MSARKRSLLDQAAIDWCNDTNECHFCGFDPPAIEHDDECPLRVFLEREPKAPKVVQIVYAPADERSEGCLFALRDDGTIWARRSDGNWSAISTPKDES